MILLWILLMALASSIIVGLVVTFVCWFIDKREKKRKKGQVKEKCLPATVFKSESLDFRDEFIFNLRKKIDDIAIEIIEIEQKDKLRKVIDSNIMNRAIDIALDKIVTERKNH